MRPGRLPRPRGLPGRSRLRLVLKKIGNFFVGGEDKRLGPDSEITVGQMYVEYKIPAGAAKVPVIMVHGCCLSSKSWQETPDGRMGWDEYFVRKGHPTYLADQVGRARSGFDAQIFNDVRAGSAAADRPASGLMGRSSVFLAGVPLRTELRQSMA